MYKLFLIGLLLVLSSQLALKNHLQDDPLTGRTFKIANNFFQMEKLNGMTVSFNEGTLSFKGCNDCSTNYVLGEGNSFSLGSWTCTDSDCGDDDDDGSLKTLFDTCVSYII